MNELPKLSLFKLETLSLDAAKSFCNSNDIHVYKNKKGLYDAAYYEDHWVTGADNCKSADAAMYELYENLLRKNGYKTMGEYITAALI